MPSRFQSGKCARLAALRGGEILRAWILALFLLLLAAMNSRADQFDALRLYWQNYLITSATNPAVLANAGTNYSMNQSGHFYLNITPATISSTASNYWSTMNTNSSSYLWSDLTIHTVSANITTTFDRLQMMALAWATPGSSLQGNPSLGNAVVFGLDWMNTNTYAYTASRGTYNNWFNWVISGPESLLHTMVLMYPALTGTQITNYCTAIDNFSPGGAHATSGGWMSGANTSDMVLVMTLRGMVGKDGSRITTAQSNLGPVFNYVTSSDGFYTDGSFIFHSNLAYNGHYGLVLLGDIPELVNLLQGSAWQITNPALTNVYNWVFNSYEPFFYNGAMMDMVRGRVVSFPSETEWIDGSTTLATIQQIAQFAPAAMATAMSNFVNSPLLPPGQFHFPNMDRVVALRNGFGFGIAMSSTRIANYESINGNNLHGWFTGDGMTYLYIGNTENQFNGNFWATVDPYHLPGTTEETNSLGSYLGGEGKTTDQNWAGGAQVANTYGVAGLSLHASATNTTLFAKKSWFMLDNEIVCLGAGITCGDPSGVQTTAENRKLATPITNSFTLNGVAITPTAGWSSNLPSATPSWCALSGTGGYYFPAGNPNLQAAFNTNSGSWLQINTEAGMVTDPSVFTDNYLKLWFNHGQHPTNATYAYVLLPGMDTTSISNYALNPDIVILTNTATIQAVKKPALGVVAANFWTNGTSSADLITVNSQASVITSETSSNISVGISDPTQTNKSSITVTLNRPALSLASADSGVSVVQLTPQIILSVNVNGSHGRTFQASLQLTPPATTNPPVAAIIMPATNVVYLNSTNDTLLLTATASNTVPTNAMTTVWSQTGGTGSVTFGNPGALTTTASFSATGTYGITFTASNGVATNLNLTVAVGTLAAGSTNGLLGWWPMDETGGLTAFDSSGNGQDATLNGGTFTNGDIGDALHLPGGTNNAQFISSVDATQTTIAAWVRADSRDGSLYPHILGAPGYHLIFRFDSGSFSNSLDFATAKTAYGTTPVNGEWLTAANTISSNAWYHVAVSYDNGSLANVPSLYINGVKMAITTATTPSVTPPAYAGTNYIGNRLDLARGWDGLIDDLRIYNRLLSDAEVQTLATIGSQNLAPMVNAGASQAVVLPAAAALNGTVSDDGNPAPPGAVTVAWSEVSGPGTVTFGNANAPATTANFSVTGSYQLQLSASDGQVTTVSTTTVTAITRPNLSIALLPGAFQLAWPTNDGNWQLQYQTNPITTGLWTNWQTIPGTITNPFVAPIDPNAPTAFFRLLWLTN